MKNILSGIWNAPAATVAGVISGGLGAAASYPGVISPKTAFWLGIAGTVLGLMSGKKTAE